MKNIRIQLTAKEKDKLKAYKAAPTIRTFLIKLKNEKEYLDNFIQLTKTIELEKTNCSINFNVEEDLDTFLKEISTKYKISKTNIIRYFISQLEEKEALDNGSLTNITTFVNTNTKHSLEQKAKKLQVTLNFLIKELFKNYEYKKLHIKTLKSRKKITLNCNEEFKEKFHEKANSIGISNSLLLKTFLYHLDRQEKIDL